MNCSRPVEEAFYSAATASGRALTRTDLRELGLERRAVDAVFRACPVIQLPGYARPLVRVEDFHRLVEESSYGDDRVRPCL